MASLKAKREALALLEEKLARRAAASFDGFCRYVDLPGTPITDDEDCAEFYPDRVTPAEHHRLVIETLQKVEAGELRRVMFFMPPGSAKSTYASVAFPPWYMGRKARRSIIATSYGSDLAKKFGRKCRSITRSAEFERAFKATLTGDNAAVDDWSITNGSTYMSGGILSGITGNRADGLLIDDPVKGREDADSETIREKTWEAYKSDLRSRLKPSGFIVIIQTRWHEDDLSGRILPENYTGESGWVTARDGERWFVVNLPALCERDDDPLGRKPGEWLWTDWFSPEHWEQERKTQGPRNWSALFQQRPSPEEGDFFRREWIQYYDTPPVLSTMRIYGASDYAVSDGEGDFTVHGVVGVDPEDNVYVLDWWRKQTASDEWVETFLDMVRDHKPLEWAEEAGQIKKSLDPFIRKRQMERKIYTYRQQYPSTADKRTRAQSIRGRMAMGKVYFPRNADWTEPLVSELLTFDSGRNDDQVDVMGLVGRMLDRMATGEGGKLPPPPITGLGAATMDRLWKDTDTGRRRRETI